MKAYIKSYCVVLVRFIGLFKNFARMSEISLLPSQMVV